MFNYSLTKDTVRDKKSGENISLHTHTSVFTRATMPCEAFEKHCWGAAHLRWSGEHKRLWDSRFGFRVQLFTKATIRDKKSGKNISLHTHTSVFTGATVPCDAFEKNSWGVAYLCWSGEHKLFWGSRPINPSPKVPFVTKKSGNINSLHTHTSAFARATMVCETFEKNCRGVAHLSWSEKNILGFVFNYSLTKRYRS